TPDPAWSFTLKRGRGGGSWKKVRAAFYDNNGMKKGEWSAEEDDKLRTYVQKYGHWNWHQLPKFAGLKRCGKSCRWRWMNYLRPGLKRGNFTEEEDALIIKLHEQFRNRWSTIAKSLRGRTDNEIKNHWHSQLKKSTKGDEEEKCSSWQSEATQNENICEGEAESNSIDNMTLGSSPPSSPSPSSSSGSMSSLNAVGRLEDTRLPYLEIYETESSGDFWSQPFVTDNTSSLEKGGFELPLPYDDMYYDDFADLLCGLWT
ncbi:hypothetical protein Gotri_000638, partial [Gossypium trilobum]|nr:hypothetical protein [Gossypium trilobum]